MNIRQNLTCSVNLHTLVDCYYTYLHKPWTGNISSTFGGVITEVTYGMTVGSVILDYERQLDRAGHESGLSYGPNLCFTKRILIEYSE